MDYVGFLPTDPLTFISISGGKFWQWDINGHQISSIYDGTHITFPPGHARFALCNRSSITVQNSNSRVIAAEFHVADEETECCCFSPNGKLVAAAAGHTIYVWDITTPDPHLIETFVGHTNKITSLVFSSSSSLISASKDQLVKFWKIGVLLCSDSEGIRT